MERIVDTFSPDGLFIAVQIVSLLHVPLAAVATVLALQRRTELARALWLVLLIAWLVPTIGPLSIIVGLLRSRRRTDQPAQQLATCHPAP